MRRSSKIVLVVSIALLASEIGLVYANWRANARRVERVIQERGATLREGFAIAKATTELQLAAIANFIADVDDVRRRLDLGQAARKRGDDDATETYRRELQQIVGQRWHNLQFRFLLRQLAFYFPDGIAFLRSDQAYRHGDDAATHSPMVQAATAQRRPVTGFEIGQWSTGLRAVTPVYDSGSNGERRYLGLVEVGISFDPMLVPICPTAECGLAVLLERGAIAALPAGVRDTQFSPDRVAGDWVMEASSNPALTRRFAGGIRPMADGAVTRLVRVEGQRWFGVTTFALRDFAALADGDRAPVGVVAAWQDATELVAAADADLRENILFAALAFLLVETFLILSVRMVTRRLEVEIDIATAEVRSLLDKVTAMAERDPLTDLYNRRSFDQRMAEVMSLAERTHTPLSLAIIDLDKFKSINDTYGHGAGDRVIARIAKLVHEMVRVSDIPCRWGGEEFVLAMPATEDGQAMVLLDRLRRRLTESNEGDDSDTPAFTFSAGIAQLQSGDTLDTLLKRADRALYRAKNGGRDRIETETAAEAAV
ncbi:MAG: diguanylate cyclase [Magnetospirillum sp.]|nr:diguanylate cyclase [Magnetospirillum sp.]